VLESARDALQPHQARAVVAARVLVGGDLVSDSQSLAPPPKPSVRQLTYAEWTPLELTMVDDSQTRNNREMIHLLRVGARIARYRRLNHSRNRVCHDLAS
jgi:hypothetical protein